MPKYVKNPTWADGSGGGTRVDAADLNVIEAGIYDSSVGRSTTFPASPVDGEMHVYPADTTNGIMWHFMYRSAPNDWEFIGGSPLYAVVETSETMTGTAYADLATAGPSITIPFNGDFLLSWGAHMFNASSVAWVHYAAVKFGGAATSDNDSVQVQGPNPGASNAGASVSRQKAYTGLTATTVLKLQYKNLWGSGTPTGNFAKRFLNVIPIRYTP